MRRGRMMAMCGQGTDRCGDPAMVRILCGVLGDCWAPCGLQCLLPRVCLPERYLRAGAHIISGISDASCLAAFARHACRSGYPRTLLYLHMPDRL